MWICGCILPFQLRSIKCTYIQAALKLLFFSLNPDTKTNINDALHWPSPFYLLCSIYVRNRKITIMFKDIIIIICKKLSNDFLHLWVSNIFLSSLKPSKLIISASPKPFLSIWNAWGRLCLFLLLCLPFWETDLFPAALKVWPHCSPVFQTFISNVKGTGRASAHGVRVQQGPAAPWGCIPGAGIAASMGTGMDQGQARMWAQVVMPKTRQGRAGMDWSPALLRCHCSRGWWPRGDELGRWGSPTSQCCSRAGTWYPGSALGALVLYLIFSSDMVSFQSFRDGNSYLNKLQ